MKWPFVNGHCIPPEELNQHEAQDWCSCKPTPIYDAEHQLWWRHNYFDNTPALLEAAESIRLAESVKLHQNAELRGLKMNVIPYTGIKKIQMPRVSYRNEEKQ